MLLNPTAAWIWLHWGASDLNRQYASRFRVPSAQAQADIDSVVASWEQISPPAGNPAPPPSFPPLHAGITCRIERTTFLIRLATAALCEELFPRLAALEVPAANPDYTFDLIEHDDVASVFLNGVLFATEPFITGLRAVLLQELGRLSIPKRHYTAILHAGAIGNSRSCLILAGASFAGKSTLCAALMQSGLICYSDDSAALTPSYQIVGLPFALSLREGSWPLFPHLGGTRWLNSNLHSNSPTANPTGLLFIQYDSTAESLTLEPVEIFDALVGLQQSGIWVEHTKPAIAGFLDWFAGLPIYRLRYSQLDEAVAKVHALLNASQGNKGR